MAIEWTPGEDLRPGRSFVRDQPEKTGRGDIWTWIIAFGSTELKPSNPSVRCYQQFQVRDCSGQYITTEGRIYSPESEEAEDGA
jgi:hypothetical protein